MSLGRVTGAVVAAGAAFALAACGTGAGAADAPVVDTPATEATASGDWEWTRDRDYFVVGYLPNNEDSPHFATAQEGLSDAMSELLGGMEVRELHVSDPTAMIEAIRLGHIDMGILGATAVVDAYERAGAEPVVTMIREAGNIRSYTFVRADSDIQTLEDLEGTTFAFVDPVSTTSTLLPSLAIIEAMPERGLDFEVLQAPGQFFDGVLMTGSHPNVVQAVIMGDADAGGVASPQIATVLEAEGLPADYLRVIHASAEQIGASMVLSADLDPALVAAVQAMLLDFDNVDYFVGMWDAPDARFFPISIEDFAEVFALVAARG
ncbi:MAG: phosphate/phosphite/phosphonate ABC transporter substrate-binding protein [Promicromonosporaceae bacterium]|nr:phosphate/phosphite/phosphonate ABC transporter substrate-binding protein [Promicromonosporaceae bacterium]